MKEHSGIWLPDGDTHFPEQFIRSPKLRKWPTYQVEKFLSCLQHIKRFHHAVDAGAHVGLWSMVLQQCFKKLTAFEPMPEHADCWERNVNGAVLHRTALGDGTSHKARMKKYTEYSGCSHIHIGGEIKVACTSLDSMDLAPIDFLKIDCEGYEYFVLKGAEKTIKRDRPCILVELGPRERYNFREEMRATDLLKSWGAEIRFTMGPDNCMSWPE